MFPQTQNTLCWICYFSVVMYMCVVVCMYPKSYMCKLILKRISIYLQCRV